RGKRDLVAHARLDWEAGELDAHHEAAAPDLADGGERRDVLVEGRREQGDLRLRPLEGALPREDVEVGERGGARERVAGVGMAVEEGAELGERAEEPLVDRLGGERRGER